MLSVWEAFLQQVEIMENTVDYKKPGLDMKAIEFRDKLIAANFFASYSKFISIEKNSCKVIAHFELCDSTIENAARRFFDLMYEKNAQNPQIETEFRSKTSKGLQVG